MAIAEAMIRLRPEVSLSFVGTVNGFERPLIAESGLTFASYDEVRAGPLHGVSRGRQIISLFNLAIGTLQSLGLMLRRKPQALLLTGGWVGFPIALAAWLWRVPALIYLPDIEPGLTIRVLRYFARRIALTAEDSKAYFPRNETVVTGYPLRQSLLSATRETGVAFFKLDPNRKTLLVWGGSRGARAINYALLDIVPQLVADGIQIIHVTGTLDWPDIEKKRNAMSDATNYLAFPYLHSEMGLAMAAADLVVSRAGASVLGEMPFFGLPGILIPYPYAWRYQKVNADYLEKQGAALYLDESNVAQDLLPTIQALLNDNPRLEKMQASARALARPDSAAQAAENLLQLAGGRA